MPITRLLIANRGEIAIRIGRAAADLGLRSVAVHSRDDARSLHVRATDEARGLPGQGAAAYLDADAVIAAAKASGCDAVHPGYGFLSERADFARLIFVGPTPEHLELFGDKARARTAAVAADVPVIHGMDRAVSLQEAQAFFASLRGGAMIIKAVAGGGGRGTRAVFSEAEIDPTYQRCRSEAEAAFGCGDVYVEQYIPRARHIEVQILGDLSGTVTHLGERECSIQRRFQKIIEVAPAPALDDELRCRIVEAAVRFAKSVGYTNLGTFEFLVDVTGQAGAQPFVFIETNARLQVEHTVTEEVTGVDLVQAQILLAQGSTLNELGLGPEPTLRGYAIQARVNMETVEADGSIRPGGGMLAAYEAPSGPGVRTDGFGYTGYRTLGAFDSLLAKVIAHSPRPNFAASVTRAARALSEFRIDGVDTNIPFLHNILAHPDFISGQVHTRWVDDHIAELARTVESRQRYVELPRAGAEAGFAGARVKSRDPLALFEHDAAMKAEQQAARPAGDEIADMIGPDGSAGIASPIQGMIVAINVAVGNEVRPGQQVAVVEAMKMEHVITAPRGGIVRKVTMTVGDVVRAGFPIVFVQETGVAGDIEEAAEELDLDHIRGDLRESIERMR
jgi:acetyl/propionyl-CoA carboxylase alpha subunit